jgi:hypothetical protein
MQYCDWRKIFTEIFRFLYDLFTHPKISDAEVPMLIACSKSDECAAALSEKMRLSLEREL